MAATKAALEACDHLSRGAGIRSCVNLALMGLRGSGKTTVGRLVASRLKWAFVDLDDQTPSVLDPHGALTVREAWQRHGEAAFRKAESIALDRVVSVSKQIIALGGGTPTVPGAAERLREHTRVGDLKLVYLHASPQQLRDRLERTDLATRPSLTGSGVLTEIPAVYAARDPLYRSLATHIIEVGGATAEAISDEAAKIAMG